jgi:hypothetical protein
MILNENDSRTMSSSGFTVNEKKRYLRITSSIFSIFQNAFIGNVAITIYWVEMLLFDNSFFGYAYVEYTIKLPYKVI